MKQVEDNSTCIISLTVLLFFICMLSFEYVPTPAEHFLSNTALGTLSILIHFIFANHLSSIHFLIHILHMRRWVYPGHTPPKSVGTCGQAVHFSVWALK